MASPSNVVFQTGKLWDESLTAAIKDSPNVIQKIEEFRRVKQENPLAPFGGSDSSFSSSGLFKQALPKARKAHLTQDISIIYELSGKNPTVIKLYGVFTHANLGTGQPANKKIQKNMAKKLAVSENDG